MKRTVLLLFVLASGCATVDWPVRHFDCVTAAGRTSCQEVVPEDREIQYFDRDGGGKCWVYSEKTDGEWLIYASTCQTNNVPDVSFDAVLNPWSTYKVEK